MAGAAKLRIAVLGECMVEIRPERTDAGYTGPNVNASLAFGGDTLNVVVYLARQGIAVEYVTALGDDPLSDWMLSEWRKEGVGCGLVRRDPGQVPGSYLIHVDAHGERSFYYWRANSPASRMLDDDGYATELFSKLQTFACIYVSGITLAIYRKKSRQRLLSFLERFHQNGGRIFFDNNYRASLWPDPDEAKQVFEHLYRLSDIALPTLDDEYQLFGDTSANEVVQRLRGWGAAEIVLKNGAEGCTVICGDSTEHVPAAFVKKVVDTTAAGDSFNAGYLGARLTGADPQPSAARGNRIASIVVQHRGAIVPVEATAEALAKT